MKIPNLIILSLLFSLAMPAHAKCGGKRGGGKCGKPSRASIAQAKRAAQREKEKEAVKEYLLTKDLNKDGSLSMDEFCAGEDSKSQAEKAFEQANKNGDRYLTKSEIGEMLGFD